MAQDNIEKSQNDIQKALTDLEIGYLQGRVSEDQIQKARTQAGTYADTYYARKRGLVGQPYKKGDKKEEDFHDKHSPESAAASSNKKMFDDKHKDLTAEDHKNESYFHHGEMVRAKNKGDEKGERYHKSKMIEHQEAAKEKEGRVVRIDQNTEFRKLDDLWSRKASNLDRIDSFTPSPEFKKEIDKLPHFELPKSNAEYGKFLNDLPTEMTDNRIFVLKHGKDSYLIDSEGNSYARYALKIEESKEEKKVAEHELAQFDAKQLQEITSKSSDRELVGWANKVRESTPDHVVNALHDKLKKRGGKPTFKRREGKNSAIGKHISDMKRPEKVKWAKELNIKDPELLSNKELDGEILDANVKKQVSEFKKKGPSENDKLKAEVLYRRDMEERSHRK